MAFGNYTIAGTATQIVAANTGTPRRIALMIRNRSATDTLFLGDANTVTASNGYPLEAGEELILDFDGGVPGFFYRGAVWGISGGSVDTRYWELIVGRS